MKILWLFPSCLLVFTLVAGSCVGTTPVDGQQEEEEEEEDEEEASTVTKPTVGEIPDGWYKSDESGYPSLARLDGTQWGSIKYMYGDSEEEEEDEEDEGVSTVTEPTINMVYILYGTIPPELVGNETDIDVLIRQAALEKVNFGSSETGTMTVAGHLAGYEKAYDSENAVYFLGILFIIGATCIDIYAVYDANTAIEAQVMSLINSIR